ncbi:unnamed protein product [Prorocentrum cordatum]|uniref:Uncharacterized protein n=1 Tax=Prorocentrum cordatum TaxID=2364126 RepID=A0ABN9V3H8_9DINO|nr:unnamed protein product [Polarella glacialis]
MQGSWGQPSGVAACRRLTVTEHVFFIEKVSWTDRWLTQGLGWSRLSEPRSRGPSLLGPVPTRRARDWTTRAGLWRRQAWEMLLARGLTSGAKVFPVEGWSYLSRLTAECG